MSESEPQVNGKTPAPPMMMIEPLVMQLEQSLTLMPVPDYVEKATRDFVAALRKWGETSNA